MAGAPTLWLRLRLVRRGDTRFPGVVCWFLGGFSLDFPRFSSFLWGMARKNHFWHLWNLNHQKILLNINQLMFGVQAALVSKPGMAQGMELPVESRLGNSKPSTCVTTSEDSVGDTTETHPVYRWFLVTTEEASKKNPVLDTNYGSHGLGAKSTCWWTAEFYVPGHFWAIASCLFNMFVLSSFKWCTKSSQIHRY